MPLLLGFTFLKMFLHRKRLKLIKWTLQEIFLAVEKEAHIMGFGEDGKVLCSGVQINSMHFPYATLGKMGKLFVLDCPYR